MKIILYDFEKDKEYKIKNVKVEDLDYYFNCYIRDVKNSEKRAEKIIKKWSFFNAMLVVGYLSFWGLYELKPSFEDLWYLEHNLFEDDKLVAGNIKVEYLSSILEKKLGVTIDDENKDEYLLLDAVLKNRNLTEPEKAFCYKYIDMFLDNPYLNKEETYKSLLNFDISYKERPSNIEETVDGIYSSRFNIEVYEEDNTNTVLAHELIHCIYHNGKTDSLPRFFREGMTELLNNEYFSENPFYELKYYPFETIAVKMLCEVTSPDIVLKAFSYGDMSYITKEMGKYLGGEEKAIETIDILSNCLDTYYKGEMLDFSDQIEFNDKCLYNFRTCIENKEGSDVNTYDKNELLFECIFSNHPKTSYRYRLDTCYNEKAYFSNKLKEQIIKEQNRDNLEKTKVLEMK